MRAWTGFFLSKWISFSHHSWLFRGHAPSFNNATYGLEWNYIGLPYFLFIPYQRYFGSSPNFGPKEIGKCPQESKSPLSQGVCVGSLLTLKLHLKKYNCHKWITTKKEQFKADGLTINVTTWHSKNQERHRMHFNWVVCSEWSGV